MQKISLAHKLFEASGVDYGSGLRGMAGNAFPFLSADYLAVAYRELAEELSEDINSILPVWARNDANHLLKKKKFVVCGSHCRPEIKLLAKNAEVLAIVDDYMPSGSRIFGIPVIRTDEWVDLVRRSQEIVSCILMRSRSGFQHFVRQCIQWELRYLGPLQYFHLLKLNSVSFKGVAGRLTQFSYDFSIYAVENYQKLLQLSEEFEDEYSRISWLSILLYRITLNPFFLEACTVGRHIDRFGFNSYEINRQFFKLSDDEVYVDTGAYIGYTIEAFLRAVNGRFKHIYSFEPSVENNKQIRARLNGLQHDYLEALAGKISLIEKGVWSCDDTLLFNPCTQDVFDVDMGLDTTCHTASTSAHIVGAGFFDHMYTDEIENKLAYKVPVTTIDNATDQTATFIKFEVEGSELMALQGSAKTLERNRPKISLPLYHKPDDFIVLFEHMLNLKLGYKFGFRQHDFVHPDAMVLYCYQ